MNRLETALRDANAQRGLSRSNSRRTSKDTAATRQLSRNSSSRRRSMASPSTSLRQSREGFESNLAAERSVLPAGLHLCYCHIVAAALLSPYSCQAFAALLLWGVSVVSVVSCCAVGLQLCCQAIYILLLQCLHTLTDLSRHFAYVNDLARLVSYTALQVLQCLLPDFNLTVLTPTAFHDHLKKH